MRHALLTLVISSLAATLCLAKGMTFPRRSVAPTPSTSLA